MAVNAADAWQQSGARPDRPSRSPRADRSMDRSAAAERPARRPVPPPAVPPRAVPPRAVPPRERPVDRSPDRGRPADYHAQEPQYGPPPVPRRPAQQDWSGPVRDARPDAARPVDRAPARQDWSAQVPDARGGAARPARRPAPVAETGGSRLRGSLAVLVMFVLTLGACGIDSLMGVGPGMITLVVLALVTALAAFVVRRRDLLTVVVSPPLVFVAVLIVKIVATPALPLTLKNFVPLLGLNLVSGFPTMAVGLGVALVVGLIRLATRR